MLDVGSRPNDNSAPFHQVGSVDAAGERLGTCPSRKPSSDEEHADTARRIGTSRFLRPGSMEVYRSRSIGSNDALWLLAGCINFYPMMLVERQFRSQPSSRACAAPCRRPFSSLPAFAAKPRSRAGVTDVAMSSACPDIGRAGYKRGKTCLSEPEWRSDPDRDCVSGGQLVLHGGGQRHRRDRSAARTGGRILEGLARSIQARLLGEAGRGEQE